MNETLAVAVAAVAGGLIGAGADWLARRWPEHEAGCARHGWDWRTPLVVLAGAGLVGGLVARWTEPLDALLLLPVAVVLVVLLAIDLDQRLLPDLLTLPLAAYAAALLVLGRSPLLSGLELGLASGVAAGIGAPVLLWLSDRLLGGGLGGGDLKLAAGIGLLAGVTRLAGGFLVASFLFALVVLALMLARRIGRRTYVPFGPALIGAAGLALLLP